MDEGSYQPDLKLAKVREVAEEALKIAHQLKLVKTMEEAQVESDSDWFLKKLNEQIFLFTYGNFYVVPKIESVHFHFVFVDGSCW